MSVPITDEQRIALEIAIKLMKRHLEAATPGGAGRDSHAYKMAQSRITTLEDMLK